MSRRRGGTTLIDVLAGIVLLAATIGILAPLALAARRTAHRADAALEVQRLLAATPIPASAAGACELPQSPGLRLRWDSRPLAAAPGGGEARLARLRIMRGDDVVAERLVPVLRDGP